MNVPARPEVLAPAGDAEMLRAAVSGGADAVYFGLRDFNARVRARNFGVEELDAAVRWLHGHGRRAYLALNTLVFDGELPAIEQALRSAAAAGVDALIVQDLGVLSLARELVPTLRLHASTQLTVADPAAAALLAEAGVSRVTLARELDLPTIAAMARSSPVELEVFVHGALCISYSGQCLASEAIGARSANRGACAQACRLPYELSVDGVTLRDPLPPFLLSAPDLEASTLVPELVRCGVAALKIEGRLKHPDYAAATARLYRAAVDAATGASPPPDPELVATALQMYTRGSGHGWLRGTDHQRLVEGTTSDHRGLPVGIVRDVVGTGARARLLVELADRLACGDGVVLEAHRDEREDIGGRVWELDLRGRLVEDAAAGGHVAVWLGPDRPLPTAVIGRRLLKTSDPRRTRAADAIARGAPARRSLHLTLQGDYASPPRLVGRTDEGLRVEVSLDAPLRPGARQAATAEVLGPKLARLGDTPFALGELTLALPPDAMVPLGALNRARRAVVEALLAAGHRPHATAPVSLADLLARPLPPEVAPLPGGLVVLCRRAHQASAALLAGADAVLLDLPELADSARAVRELREQGAPAVGLALPRVRRREDARFEPRLLALRPDLLLVRALGSMGVGAELHRVGDASLNVTNRLAAAALLRRGLAAITPAHDLDAAQLLALVDGPLASRSEVVIHAALPIFHTDHCLPAARLSGGRARDDCGRPCSKHTVSLRDRTGLELPVEVDLGCRNTVFHGVAQSAAELIPRLRRCGVRRFRVELLRESAATTTALVGAYRALIGGRLSAAEALRAVRAASGMDIVRGTLRLT